MQFDPTITTATLISLVALIFSGASGIYAWISTRRGNVDKQISDLKTGFEGDLEAHSKATEERFKVGSDRMDRHEVRLNSAEQTIKILPSKEDLHKIELGLSKVDGTMGRMEALMEGNQKIMGRLEMVVSRHEDHLLNNK